MSKYNILFKAEQGTTAAYSLGILISLLCLLLYHVCSC